MLSKGEAEIRVAVADGRARLARVPKQLVRLDVAFTVPKGPGAVLPITVCTARQSACEMSYLKRRDVHVDGCENPCQYNET